MPYRTKILVVVLFVFISFLPVSFPLQPISTQPNESVKILVTDAIEDLQNNDTAAALTHSHLASQRLSSQGVSNSDSTLVLIHDAIQDLLNNDTNTALTHLGLVNEQLETIGDGAITSAVSLNKTSELNTTLTEMKQENITAAQFANGTEVPEGMCTDNNQNGICSLDIPINSASLCYDTDKDLYCDWFKAPKITSLGIKDCGTSFDDVDVNAMCEWFSDGTIELKPVAQNTTTPQPLFNPGTSMGPDYVCYSNAYDDGRNLLYNVTESTTCQKPGYADYYFGGFKDGCMARGNTDEYCIDYVNRIDMEQRTASAVGTLDRVCQADDDFCEPGCELEDMQCIDESKGSGSNVEEYCEDLNGDGFCDITHLSDGTTMIEDQDAIERLKEGNDGSPNARPQQEQRQPSGSIVPGLPQQNRINWGAICRNPVVDSFVSELCETLTSPDGFTLTPRGQRVLVCLGVGGIAAYLAPEILASIKSLGPAVGCGTNTGGGPSPIGQGNPLDTMLGGLFRK